MATAVTREHLTVTLYVHCLSWLFLFSGTLDVESPICPLIHIQFSYAALKMCLSFLYNFVLNIFWSDKYLCYA
jgi:hypothetical protein